MWSHPACTEQALCLQATACSSTQHAVTFGMQSHSACIHSQLVSSCIVLAGLKHLLTVNRKTLVVLAGLSMQLPSAHPQQALYLRWTPPPQVCNSILEASSAQTPLWWARQGWSTPDSVASQWKLRCDLHCLQCLYCSHCLHCLHCLHSCG